MIDKFLSIDFGLLFIKVIFAQRQQDKFKILAYDLKKIPLSEENIPATIDFIHDFLKKNSVSAKNAYLTVSDPHAVIIKHLVLPLLPKNEVLNAIQWQLKDEFNFSWEGVLTYWQSVKEYIEEDGTKKQELMFVCLKDIERYLAVCRQCDLLPLGITSTAFNYANILRYYNKGIKTQAVLDIGSSDSMLCIYIENKLAFLRRLAFSSEKVTQSLTDTLLTTKGPLKLTYEKAEEVKNTFGIPQDETAMLEENLAAIHVFSLIRPLLELLVREIKYSFDYFTLNFKEEAPSILYLTGGGANLKNLDGYLKRELKMEVGTLDFPAGVDTSKVRDLEKDKHQLMNALGAVLTGPESVNLLPLEAKIQRLEPVEKSFLRLFFLTVAAFLLVSHLFVKIQLNNYKKRIQNAQLILAKIAEVKAGIEKLVPLEDIVYEIKKEAVPAGGLLKSLSQILPARAVLNELSLDQKNNTLVLKGVALSRKGIQEPLLAQLVSNLNKSLFFKKAVLVSSKKTQQGEDFQINCELVY
ncbi:MAG: pilus assembly protein PilM [Candidatus Omnitrophica bacterium]|nr:pilus assembly protein PilM [Candidatus Omnitrophota bacterium]